MRRFEPQLKMLGLPQRTLWKELHSTPPVFVLYGGTALSLQFGHRPSEDFDFFSNNSFDSPELLRSIHISKTPFPLNNPPIA